jgi:hypothetical protein
MPDSREVWIFTEGFFELKKQLPSLVEARAFAAGVAVGGGLYGAGSISVYVLPEDDAEMRSQEADDELAAASR